MNQAQLAQWLKFLTIIVGIIGLLVAFLFLPMIGQGVEESYPEFGFYHWPYLIWAWVTLIPCFAALCFFWKMCDEISKNNSFCHENAKRLQTISRLFLMDTIQFFAVSIVFLLLNMMHFGVLLVTLFLDVAGVSLSMIFAVLSHWVEKASELKENNDLTI